ncbi:MAG: hypothetical protein HN337_10090, partial [Deltaproteobacteria bacterium]|nr:hypothetical protein [Deltaproteobacteria bacterium]
NAGELVISWTDSENAISYNIYWGESTDVTKSTGTKIEDVTSPYTHTDLTDGVTHYYVVTAENGGGESEDSSESSGLPQIDPVGELDTAGISPNGYAQYSTENSIGYGVEIASDGRILVTGQVDTSSETYMSLWRYNTDGSIDTTFGGGDGLVTITGTAGGTQDIGWDVAVDSSDRIFVAGNSLNASSKSSMVIWCFSSDGSADTTFGTNGVVTYNRGESGNNYGNGIVVDSSDQIFIAGESAVTTDSDMALWKYTSDGELDTDFGSDGVVFHNNAAGGNDYDSGLQLAINSEGGIAVVGSSTNGSGFIELAVWRFTDTGDLDTSFNDDGIVLYDNNIAMGFSITFDSEDRVLASGMDDGMTAGSVVVLRYTAEGVLDTSFNDDGIYAYSTGNADVPTCIKVDSRGRTVISGTSGRSGSNSSMLIIRLSTDGTPDTSFGTDGIALFYVAETSQNFGNAIRFDASGRIVIAGTTEPPSEYYMTLWRYR